MILAWLILIPFVGGLLAWLVGRGSAKAARWIAMLTMVIYLALTIAIWAGSFSQPGQAKSPAWAIDFNLPWIPQFGISLHLALDGLSIILLILTGVLGIISVAASWTEIEERVGFFHFSLLWVLAGITGVFLALDLFLFYFFWEMMLVPMYFLIAFWGHENRAYAAVKFFLFTQLSGLLMLVAILGLYFIHGQNTGTYTFDYLQLLGTQLTPQAALWLMLGFLIAFAVKIPVVPVHTWLPDAHTEAPTAGSIILAGLLLKTGAYGLIRFVVPLFPSAASTATPLMMVLGVIGILYGALLAFGQTDLKRMVAYTSISHMGFVVLGVFAWNQLALQGAVMQIVSHGISTGALFALVGALQERTHTREMGQMGGLWETMPRMGGIAMIFALASMGLPGLGNFVAEFLVLLGAYQASITMAILASLGLITATVYALWMIQKAFQGSNTAAWRLPDFSARELAIMGVLIVIIVWLGLFPQPVLDTAQLTLNNIEPAVGQQITLPAALDAPTLAFYSHKILPANSLSQEGGPR